MELETRQKLQVLETLRAKTVAVKERSRETAASLDARNAVNVSGSARLAL